MNARSTVTGGLIGLLVTFGSVSCPLPRDCRCDERYEECMEEAGQDDDSAADECDERRRDCQVDCEPG
jgi:hypothetical protein